MKLKIFCKKLSVVLCGVFLLGIIACSSVPGEKMIRMVRATLKMKSPSA